MQIPVKTLDELQRLTAQLRESVDRKTVSYELYRYHACGIMMRGLLFKFPTCMDTAKTWNKGSDVIRQVKSPKMTPKLNYC